MLVATFQVARPPDEGPGWPGALLCALAFLGMMFESRQVYARGEVAGLMGLGTLGLAVTGTIAALSGSISQTWLLGGLLVATVGLVGLAMLSEGAHIRMLKMYDAVELMCLAALLPLGALAAGFVG
jgi:hypothetical protein